MPLEPPPRVQVSQRPADKTTVENDVDQLKAFVVAASQYMSTLYTKCRGTVLARDVVLTLAPLTQAISNPPTQAEVQVIQAQINDILAALQTQINTGQ